VLPAVLVNGVPQYSLKRNPGLYFRTVRHLKLSQLYWLVVRRLLPAPKFTPLQCGEVNFDIRHADWLGVPQPTDSPDEFRFLNESKTFDPDGLESFDWVAADEKKLWRYNLHYFDYLHWDSFSDDTKDGLINSWIAACPPKQAISWDPYTTSLRMVNWIKYFLAVQKQRDIPQHWLDSLLSQAKWLSQTMEYQILANHLVKNGKAMVFAGLFFKGSEGAEFLQLGCRVMLSQLREQFLTDGAHFERSPMYHLIVLEDYLDFVNLMKHQHLPVSDDRIKDTEERVAGALQYMLDTTAGDDRIALFNDSAFGIAPEPKQFADYGKTLFDYVSPRETGTPVRVYKPEAGYYGYRKDGDSFLIDCGPVGPDYQPGHAHSDTLSYELCIDGQRLVVDTGTYTYELCERRYENRQTAAHNTLRIDKEEQTEVWDSWRVGRRAYPLNASLSDWESSKLCFKGSHDGYKRLAGSPVHEREAIVAESGSWQIVDRVSGTGSHLLESFIHLHPDIDLKQVSDREFEFSCGGVVIASLSTDETSTTAIEDSYWCPEFGVKQENKVLVLRQTKELPAEMTYTIIKRTV